MMGAPRVTVPADPPRAPNIGASGVALLNVTSLVPFHQFVDVTSQVPEPSCAPVSSGLASQVKLAACKASGKRRKAVVIFFRDGVFMMTFNRLTRCF